jgi:hypothetical protein
VELNDRSDPRPFFYQPDTGKCLFVAAKPEKLVCRAPREYVIVGTKPDGERVEAQLGRATFEMSLEPPAVE